MNAHMLVVMNNLGPDSIYAPYVDSLPTHDMTMNVYWTDEVLKNISSPIIREEYARNMRFYNGIAKEFVEFEVTKYDKNEWNWALNSANSRITLLENTDDEYQNNPTYEHIITPIAEYLNHSNNPNVILRSAQELIEDENHDTIQCKALRGNTMK